MYPNLDAETHIWDGRRTIRIHERVKPNGTVVHSASITPGKHDQVTQSSLPWACLGGTLVKMLTKALTDGTEIHIEQTEEGHCRLEIRYDYGSTMATVLDPGRAYLPFRKEILVQGDLRRCEEIEFEAVDPGVWFPTAVWIQSAPWRKPPSPQPVPRLRFTNIRINAPDFDRLLVPLLPEGSTVADRIRGANYIVGHKSALDLDDNGSPSPDSDQAVQPEGSDPNLWQETFDAVYSLDANQALKRVAPPFPPVRRQFIINHEPHQAQVPGAAFMNTTCLFQYDNDLAPKVCFQGRGFLKLSEILQYACGLDIVEYSGPEHLLDLRLAGDWIVRQDATMDERLRSLERILYEETGKNVTFKKQRVDTPVVKATGIFQYHRLPGALNENDVQLFADASSNQSHAYTGGGSGTLAQFLRHLTNRTGQRFVAETLSSDMDVSWSDYQSSKLAPYDGPQQMYRHDLALLLENVTQQTRLTFTRERRKIDEWHLHEKPLESDS